MNRIALSCYLIFVTYSLMASQTRQAADVFKKWTTWQKIIPDYDKAQAFQGLNRAQAIKKRYEQNLTQLRPIANVLEALSGGSINSYGHQIKNELSLTFENNLAQLVSHAYNDITTFLQLLSNYQCSKFIQASTPEQINIYNAFMTFIFAHDDEEIQHHLLFSLANRFFEFCFSQPTSSLFQHMILTKQHQPLIRMIYAIMWEKLAGSGWKHWHEQSLKALKQEADAGKTIVYLAGGSDIYQMITHGIYSIHIIDPQLPTQPKYYADQWDWLVRNNEQADGGLGDKIVFDDHNLVMERVFFQETGNSFCMSLCNGSRIQQAHSLTQWNIVDLKGQIVGRVIFERRPVLQQDFINTSGTTLLMSFNELYFVALPKKIDGSWGIEPTQFSENLCLFIKQLRKPITQQTICELRTASLLNASDLKFIDLGTCVN